MPSQADGETFEQAMIWFDLGAAAFLLLLSEIFIRLFRYAIDSLKTAERRRYIALSWGWMTASTVRVVQSVNFFALAFSVHSHDDFKRLEVSVIPPNATGLVTLLGYLCLLAAVAADNGAVFRPNPPRTPPPPAAPRLSASASA
jgi:hypothetical protein